MQNSQAKDLFQLQTELIDMKVDMAVSKTIDRAIAQLSDLIHNEIQGMRSEMNTRFSSVDDRISSVDARISSVEHRLIAVETKLGIKNVLRTEMRSRALDYSFKAGWLTLGGIIMYGMIIVHALLVK